VCGATQCRHRRSGRCHRAVEQRAARGVDLIKLSTVASPAVHRAIAAGQRTIEHQVLLDGKTATEYTRSRSRMLVPPRLTHEVA
jgi:hypothetical protein